MGPTAILFPGQGAQFVGMFADLYEEYGLVRDTFAQAEDALGRPIARLCFEGPEEQLNSTENTQPCLVTCEVALWRLFCSLGLQARALSGFSLGECSALVAAGVLSLEDGLKLVALRAGAMQRAVPAGQGGMLAVLGQSEEAVRALCADAGDLWPANFNCPGQIVCAGRTPALEQAEKLAAARGITVKRLAVSIPSHCALMAPAARELEEFIAPMRFAAPSLPVYTNADALPTTDPAELKRKLVLQLTHPVLFENCLQAMAAGGIDTFVEAGPGRVLSGLARKTLKGACVLRADTLPQLRRTLEELHLG